MERKSQKLRKKLGTTKKGLVNWARALKIRLCPKGFQAGSALTRFMC